MRKGLQITCSRGNRICGFDCPSPRRHPATTRSSISIKRGRKPIGRRTTRSRKVLRSSRTTFS